MDYSHFCSPSHTLTHYSFSTISTLPLSPQTLLQHLIYPFHATKLIFFSPISLLISLLFFLVFCCNILIKSFLIHSFFTFPNHQDLTLPLLSLPSISHFSLTFSCDSFLSPYLICSPYTPCLSFSTWPIRDCFLSCPDHWTYTSISLFTPAVCSIPALALPSISSTLMPNQASFHLLVFPSLFPLHIPSGFPFFFQPNFGYYC